LGEAVAGTGELASAGDVGGSDGHVCRVRCDGGHEGACSC
jgi:hypothetical protein